MRASLLRRAAAASAFRGDAATTSLLRNLETGAEVFLVGTAHVSRRSAAEVREVIRAVRPETVVLELCATRARRLQAGVAQESTLVELLRLLQAPGSVTSKALALGLRGMYGLWRHAGLEPGGEFKAAMEEAALSPSAAVVYGDQEASVTLQRLAATITLPALLSALGSAFSPSRPVPPELAAALSGKLSAEEAVEALKDRETVRALVAYMRDAQPAATRVLLDERDDILARALRSARGSRVVGVVGLAHVDGIEQRWAAMDAGGDATQSRLK